MAPAAGGGQLSGLFTPSRICCAAWAPTGVRPILVSAAQWPVSARRFAATKATQMPSILL